MEVEKRAYRMAYLATSNPDEALDIVQDAMLTLAKSYGKRSADEWGPLFHRILQNKIRDWYRRAKVRNRIFHWFTTDDDEETSKVENTQDMKGQGPMQALQNENLTAALENALSSLPIRQQQTFLLRAWEGLDVAETAKAMGISSGSVKTHYSRALLALRGKLGEFYCAK